MARPRREKPAPAGPKQRTHSRAETYNRLASLDDTLSSFLQSRRTPAERQARALRAQRADISRRLRELDRQILAVNRATNPLRQKVRESQSRRTVTLFVWLRYQNDKGEFTKETPSPKRRGLGRGVKRDGEGYVYICKKDNLSANVLTSQLGDAALDTLYWNDTAYATFSAQERREQHSLDDIRAVCEEPSIAAFLDVMSSSMFLALEIRHMGAPMSIDDGAKHAAARGTAPFGNAPLRRYRDSPYAALPVDDLADAILKEAPTEPRRCGPALLLRKYGAAIRKVAGATQWHADFEPNYEWFWKYFKRPGPYEDGDFLITPDELRSFCAEFRIPLTVINGLNKAVPSMCYDPPKRGSNFYARLCAQIVDGHLYDLNHRTTALYLRARATLLSWVGVDNEDDAASYDSDDSVLDEDQLCDGTNNSVMFATGDTGEPVWIDDVLDELPRLAWDALPPGDVHIITDQPIDEVLDAFAKGGIVPSIGMAGARITRVSIRVSHPGKTKEIVRRVHVAPPKAPRGELLPEITGRYEVERTHFHRQALRNLLQQQATASVYAGGQAGYDRDALGPQVAHIFRDFPTAAMCDRFIEPSLTPGPFVAVDQSKAHTSVLAALSNALPVFYPSDAFVAYTDQPIDVHAFYLVRHLSTAYARSLPRNAPLRLLLDRPDNLVRGANLQAAMADAEFKDRYEITWVARPSRLVNVRASLHVALRELYSDPAVSPASRKFVVNCIVGELGTKVAYRTSNYTFATYEEAAAHAHELGLNAWAVKTVGAFFVVTQETRVPLRDGRLPIYLAVLQEVRLRNYRKACELGLPLVAVKTDCLYLKGSLPLTQGTATIDAILADNGAWRVELSSPAAVGAVTYARATSTLPDLVPHSHVTPIERIMLSEAEEYNPAVLASIFARGPCYITSTVPGAGKSTAIVEFCESTKEPYLVVTPMNKLAADYRARSVPAKSLHSFLGLTVSDSKHGHGITPVAGGPDKGEFRYLVVDEIFTAPELVRVLLREWELRHPSVTVFRVGDVRQLPSIENHVRGGSDDDDMRRVEAAVLADCPRVLTLRVCKRVSSPADRTLVQSLYSLFWEKPWQGKHTITAATALLGAGKVLTRVADIPLNAAVLSFHVSTAEALAYTLAMRAKPPAATHVGTLDHGIRSPLWVWPGATLRCYSNARLGRTVNAPRLVNNARYTVTSINQRKREIALLLDGDDQPIRVGWSGVCKWFGYGAHAATGHSWQGATIKDRPLVLTDLDAPFVSRRWLWMSLTRGDDMTRVFLFEPAPSERAAFGFGGRTWQRYMQTRISGYRAQDKAALRTYNDDDYVTVAYWLELMQACNACCVHCGQSCGLDSDDNAAVLDRIVRSTPHVKDNVQVACTACNRARH
jgi:hypothetical protein